MLSHISTPATKTRRWGAPVWRVAPAQIWGTRFRGGQEVLAFCFASRSYRGESDGA